MVVKTFGSLAARPVKRRKSEAPALQTEVYDSSEVSSDDDFDTEGEDKQNEDGANTQNTEDKSKDLGDQEGEGEEDADEELEDNDSDDIRDNEDESENQGTSSEEDEPSTSGRQGKPGSMANAFAEILGHPGSSQKGIEAPILLGSKSLAKRKRKELEDTAKNDTVRVVRQEIRQRAHKKVAKKGENPEEDAREKILQKIATRGVVQLFNAVSKAQKSRQEALASGAKAKDLKISKSDFFSELKRDVANGQAAKGEIREEDHAKTWDVLRPDFAGLEGKTSVKMKDWDKTPNAAQTGDESLSEEEGEEDESSDNEGLGVW